MKLTWTISPAEEAEVIPGGKTLDSMIQKHCQKTASTERIISSLSSSLGSCFAGLMLRYHQGRSERIIRFLVWPNESPKGGREAKRPLSSGLSSGQDDEWPLRRKCQIPRRSNSMMAGDDECSDSGQKMDLVSTKLIAYFKTHQYNNCIATALGSRQHLVSSSLTRVAIHPAFYTLDDMGSSHHFGTKGLIQTIPIPSTVSNPS